MKSKAGTVRLTDLVAIDPETFRDSIDQCDEFDYIDLSGIADSGATPIVRRVSAKEAPSRAQRRVRVGDILVANVRPNLRNFTRLKRLSSCVPTIASTGFTVVRPRSESDGELLYQAILSDNFQSWIQRRMVGSGYPAISSNDIGEYPLSWNHKSAREKVVVLSALDNTIEATRYLAEQTLKLKEALAQNILVYSIRKKGFPVRIARLGELFTERSENGRPDLPTMSVTMNDGIVDREDMDRRFDSALTSEEHLLACKGDIAYNMMRMWQGVCGIVPHDSLISPAYVVVTPTKDIDATFAAHLFKLPEMIRLFQRYSQGLADDRLRLYYHQFAGIKVTIPRDKAHQKRIVRLLATLDQAADSHKTRLEALIRVKSAISNKLFSNH